MRKPGRVPLSAVDYLSGQIQGPGQTQRGCTLLFCQVGISGTHGKAVRLPDNRSPVDGDVKIQIFHHPADDQKLLIILSAEHRPVRLHNMKKLGHHRGDTLEMIRSRHAAKVLRDSCQFHISLETGRIHLFCGRQEHGIHAFGCSKGFVFFQIHRVCVKVLVFPELGGIDENAYHNPVTKLSPFSHQRQVPFMEKAHGGDQADGFIYFPGRLDPIPDSGDGAENFQLSKTLLCIEWTSTVKAIR